MGLAVDNDVLVFYGQTDSIHIDRQEPVLLSDILHRQITDGTPAAHHRMAAQDGQRLAFLQLWSRNAEECCLTIERHATGLSGLAMLRVFRGQIGISIEMGAQGHVAPLVVEHIVLGRVKPVNTRHLRPLAAQHPPVAIFHLISVRNRADGVLPTFYNSRFLRPVHTVLRLHQQIGRSDGSVLTVEVEHDMHRLAPLCAVLYCKSQFHQSLTVFFLAFDSF